MLPHMTKHEPKPKNTDAEQHARFVEMARAVQVDESADALDKVFKRVVRPKAPTDAT